MPKIIPITELKNTAAVSTMVRESPGPVYVTKNGYADMVIIPPKEYDRLMFELDSYESLLQAIDAKLEKSMAARTLNDDEVLARLAKLGVE